MEKTLELLEEILAWVKRNSDPNDRHRFHRCIVCNAVWWHEGLFSAEKHELGCWVPELQSLMKEPDNGK